MQNQQQFEERQETNHDAEQALMPQENSQALAEQGLKQLAAAHFENLLAAARVEAQSYRKRRRTNRITVSLLSGIFGLMALLWIYGLVTGRDMGTWTNFYLYGGLFSSFGGVAMSQNHKEAAQKLAEFDDVRAVGLLTETLESNDRDLTRVGHDALIRLLPRLQFSDAALLSDEQRDILNRVLPKVVTRKDRALSLAILQAYQQVGSEKDAAAVEKLAAGPVAAYDSELRQAALDCLTYLRASIARRKESHILLRASQAEDIRPETLLRPAAYVANQNDAQELLRSSQT